MLLVACTVAVICKSIYWYETGLTAVVFYQEDLLFVGKWPQLLRHGIKMPPSWDEILTCLLSDIGESFNVLCFPFLVLVVPLAPSLTLATAMFKWSCCNTQTYLLLAIKMKLHASTCGLSEWQILSKKWQVPSTTINLTNSFKWKYTLLHAGMCGLSEWHLPL